MEPVTGIDLALQVVGEVWDQITSLVSTISGNALLLVPLAGAFASLVIGLTLKLMGIRRGRNRR